MRCLLLSRYSRMGASSRLRSLQYLPYLSAHGVEVEVRCLLDDAYLRRLYAGASTPWVHVLRAYGGRLYALLRAGRYDLVWVEKELFPFLPAWAERGLRRLGIPYVVDYDDAAFHTYDLHPHPIVRTLLGQKIDQVMRHAELVTVGNAYLGTRARRAGARRVVLLPTVVDPSRYPRAAETRSSVFTVGWIGTPATVKYLDLIKEPLQVLSREGPVQLAVVGAPAPRWPGVQAIHRPWSEETEGQDIGTFDVGVMPLVDGPWEWGKCGYKLIQYMACGRPVVASPVGANRSIVCEGRNGFLAADTAAWIRALRTLQSNPALRHEMGTAGHRQVEERYGLPATAPRLAALLLESARKVQGSRFKVQSSRLEGRHWRGDS